MVWWSSGAGGTPVQVRKAFYEVRSARIETPMPTPTRAASKQEAKLRLKDDGWLSVSELKSPVNAKRGEAPILPGHALPLRPSSSSLRHLRHPFLSLSLSLSLSLFHPCKTHVISTPLQNPAVASGLWLVACKDLMFATGRCVPPPCFSSRAASNDTRLPTTPLIALSSSFGYAMQHCKTRFRS